MHDKNDLDGMLTAYSEGIKGVIDKHVPLKRCRVPDKPQKSYLIYDQKGLIFSLIEPKFPSFTSFSLVSTKASSGVLENVSLIIIWRCYRKYLSL